ncbi:MerR family transcriptional regulator [Asanoa ishikariensis]|uniref:DNA-binding transcriptional regulator, MerR family n=1 Tax=Asanoa ishikariensis TaxID=137265 RepID=A0A1H3LRQ8_9ACTN|nr:MerR family transcriptional regulator [Asanoa ishikariensis]GIF65655.1 MerR family transcriptional regulator [Asanoa ishikariensis]SDY67122.1 DNA-binding transcriptional regulator, MerR family [Asanoa ishikariensis]
MAYGIGEVAARTGLSVHALRFYEREGLFVGPIVRDPGGRRVYSDGDIGWVELCARLRETGMPLEVIRKYADLVRDGVGNEPERLALLREHQERIESQMQALSVGLSMISYKVRVYEKRLAEGTAAALWSSSTSSSGD